MIDKNNNPSFLNDFLNYMDSILNKSENTIKEYNYDLNKFLKYFKVYFKLTTEKDYTNISIRDFSLDTLKLIKLNDIYEYLSYLKNTDKNSAITRARKVASLKTFFNYLTVKANLLEINPTQNLERPKIEKKLPKHLSLDESKKLLSNINLTGNEKNKERDYAIFTLFLNCGLRLSELININISNIDFNENRMTVIGKGNKERMIYLNKACVNALNNYMIIRKGKIPIIDSEDALFLSERNKRISKRNVQYIAEREFKKCGLDSTKYSVHKLRHTAATLMYQYGNVDIRALQELLGHVSISTTEIYTHVDNNQVRDAVEKNPLSDT